MTHSGTPLAHALRKKSPLILDGAMGTELQRRGVGMGLPLWSAHALDSVPEVVLQIHKDYIVAGADIITTNTFRTNRRVFRNASLPDRSSELTIKAVELAKQARESFPDREVLIAGSIAPVEDCYVPALTPSDAELHDEHAELARRLAAAGVDLLLIETMTTVREAYAACAAAKRTGKETVVSFTCKPDGSLWGGEPLSDAVSRVMELRPAAFSLNCISPRYLDALIRDLISLTDLPFAVYANAGHPDERQGAALVRDVNPEEYAECGKRWHRLGASIIGGCCGTTPADIRALSSALPF